jgi:hypothetical protein
LRYGTFYAGAVGRPRRSTLTIPPSPDEPIRSLEAAAKVIRGHAGDHLDRKAQELLHRIKGALTPEEADAAGKAFRAWAEAEGLLPLPPEDDAGA